MLGQLVTSASCHINSTLITASASPAPMPMQIGHTRVLVTHGSHSGSVGARRERSSRERCGGELTLVAQASRHEGRLLRVGDLTVRTGASPRMLRHYANHGLIEAERSSSGQRLFEPAVADQVHHIRMLLGAGLPLRAITELLDCIHDPNRLEPCVAPILVEHLRDYDSQIAELVSSRNTLEGLIDSSTPNTH